MTRGGPAPGLPGNNSGRSPAAFVTRSFVAACAFQSLSAVSGRGLSWPVLDLSNIDQEELGAGVEAGRAGASRRPHVSSRARCAVALRPACRSAGDALAA